MGITTATTTATTTTITTTTTTTTAASSLADRGFTAEISVGPNVQLHYAKGPNNDIKLAIDVPGIGWASLAVGTSMSDADAVIGGGLIGGGQASDVRAYKLTSRSAFGVTEDPIDTTKLSDVEVLHE